MSAVEAPVMAAGLRARPRWLRAGTVSLWRRLNIAERGAALALVGVTLIAVLAPVLVPYNPLLRVGPAFAEPSWNHLFGTDEIGRDLLSRVVLGLRLTWLPCLAIIAVSTAIGGLVGLVAGAAGGWTDLVIQRITDLFLVTPSTVIVLAIVAALGPGTANVMLALALFWWPWYARIVRAEVRVLAAQPHAEAARLSGVKGLRFLLVYLLPGALPAVIVTASLDVANVVLVVAMLSFLGLGAPAPAPELGAMVARNLSELTGHWWLPILPAWVIFVMALAANLFGDALRRILRGV